MLRGGLRSCCSQSLLPAPTLTSAGVGVWGLVRGWRLGLSFPPVYKRWGLNQGTVLLLNLPGFRTDNSCSSCVENWPKPSHGVRTRVLLWGVGPKHSGRSPVALRGWGWGCWLPVGVTVPVWNVCLSKLVWPPVLPHLSPPPHKAKSSGTPTHTHTWWVLREEA